MKQFYIVSVHGTWSSSDNSLDRLWWQCRSQFNHRIERKYLQNAYSSKFIEFKWSGNNSDNDRKKAADKLSMLLLELSRNDNCQIHIIAHSHGGNIVRDALFRLAKKRLFSKKNRTIDDVSLGSIVTIGTPFFTRKIPMIRRLGFLGIIFSALIPIIILFTFIKEVNSPMTQLTGGTSTIDWLILAALVILSTVSFLFFVSEALEYWLNLRTKFHKKIGWLCIYHREDEAISSLKSVEKFDGKIFRDNMLSSRVLSSIESLYVTVFSLLILAVVPVIFLSYYSVGNRNFLHLVVLIAVVTSIIAPLAWVFVLLIGCVFQIPINFGANRKFQNFIRASAFGQDGRDTLEGISLVPDSIDAVEHEISGELHEKMRNNAIKVALSFIKEQRSIIFEAKTGLQIDEFLSSSDLTDLSGGLIHTSYFDHPEIADQIFAFQTSQFVRP